VPIAAYRGSDFIRCGRGLTSDEGTSVDADCGNAPAGALYLGPSELPELDLNQTYIIGDPNPDWTGSVRTNFRIGKLSVGGLLDIRHGGVSYNGTTGALNQFGVAERTAQARDALASANPGPPGLVVFGQSYFPEHTTGPAAGPGYG